MTQDAATKSVVANDASLYYERQGTGPAVFFALNPRATETVSGLSGGDANHRNNAHHRTPMRPMRRGHNGRQAGKDSAHNLIVHSVENEP
jgi:hypothetical protein